MLWTPERGHPQVRSLVQEKGVIEKEVGMYEYILILNTVDV
jgi:hypothetical protein